MSSTTTRVIRALTLGTALAGTACGGGSDGGGGSTPTSPTPQVLPPANIQLDGNGQFRDCVRRDTNARCDFEETGRNTGSGCATSVRIMVRFFAGDTEVAAEGRSLGSQVLLPNEEFVYSVRVSGPAETIASLTGYTRQVEWTTTRCPS